MTPSINLFSIAGIRVGIHFTWLIIFGIMMFTLGYSYLPAYAETEGLSWPIWLNWLISGSIVLLVFVSILLHELAHSLMAKRHGIEVKGITLFILGGVSNFGRESKNAGEEFSIAIVGPLASAVIGFICLILWYFVFTEASYSRLFVQLLMQVNFVVAIFNLLPGFPLDGGRVLRAIVWGSTRNMEKATNVAATSGQLLGWLCILGGIVVVLATDLSLLTGLWFSLIGLFLISAAGGQKRDLALKQSLADILVARVMNRTVNPVDPNTRVSELVETRFLRQAERSAIVCEGETLAGIVTLTDVRNLPRTEWGTTPVSKIMTTELKTVEPGSQLTEAFKIMAENTIHQLPVCIGKQLVGTVDRARIIQYLHASEQLGAR